MTEPGTVQTHNVVATIPGDADYSALWFATIYDNVDFANVTRRGRRGRHRARQPGDVYCPIVAVE